MAQKGKWTFNGIKRYYRYLTFDQWLDICARGDHTCITPRAVVANVKRYEKRKERTSIAKMLEDFFLSL